MEISFIDTIRRFLVWKATTQENIQKEGIWNKTLISIEKMYKLYTMECEEARRNHVKSKLYRWIFTHNYNLSFFKPKNSA